MSETAIEPRKASGSATFHPKAFVRAYLDGRTIAECAKIAGSNGESDNALNVTGQRWLAHPAVTKLLRDVQADLDAGWAGGVRWWRDAAQGTVKVTDQDRNAIVANIGRALGKFVQRVEVTHKGIVEIRGLKRTMRPITVDAVALPASIPVERLAPMVEPVKVPKVDAP